MSLEPIQFQADDSQNITEIISVLSDIKNIIFSETGIEVHIKKYDPPKLSIAVDNSPAASELHSRANQLIILLCDYQISTISIRIH